MPGEDQRGVLRLRGQERVECGQNVAIGEVERLGRVVGLEEKRPKRGLAITWRPYRPDIGEGARLAAHEQGVARCRLPAFVDRRIPFVAGEIGGGMNVEDGGAGRGGRGEGAGRQPL